MKTRDLNRLPIPELIDGKQWDVGEAVGHHAGTNPKQHEMLVPIEGNCPQCGLDHDRYVRVHELTHAKYSKGSIGAHAAKLEVSTEGYQLAEENFIEAIVTRSYPDLDPPLCQTEDGKVHETRDQVSMLIRNGRPDVAARMAIAAASGMSYLPAGDNGLVTQPDRLIYESLLTFSNHIRYLVSKVKYSQAQIGAIAKMIDRFLSAVDGALEEEHEKREKGEHEEDDEEAPGAGAGPDPKEKEEKFRPGRQFARAINEATSMTSKTKIKWGAMELVHPPRPINLNKKFGVRKYRASPEGSRVRNISRFYTDQKVFGRKRRYKGGTLLVDTSGSMSFSQEDLEAIVEQVPATTIAVYAGHFRHGYLRVVAKGGTAAEPRWLQSPGGNEVDGPALEWLGKQREPRIWLSDGAVCSGYEDPGDLYGDASQKCRKFNIRRVHYVEQAKIAFDNPKMGVRSAYADHSPGGADDPHWREDYQEDEDDG